MRSIGTRIFLSFLAGKNKSIKQPMAMSITLAKNFGFQWNGEITFAYALNVSWLLLAVFGVVMGCTCFIPLNKSCLCVTAFLVWFVHQSICVKIEWNDTSTNTTDLTPCFQAAIFEFESLIDEPTLKLFRDVKRE